MGSHLRNFGDTAMNTKSKIFLAAALIAVFSAPALAQDNEYEGPVRYHAEQQAPASAFAQVNGARNIRQTVQPSMAAERAWIERATEGVSQY
jgi:hypothetical protein